MSVVSSFSLSPVIEEALGVGKTQSDKPLTYFHLFSVSRQAVGDVAQYTVTAPVAERADRIVRLKVVNRYKWKGELYCDKSLHYLDH